MARDLRLENLIEDGDDGASSFAVDLCNGGHDTIVGNNIFWHSKGASNVKAVVTQDGAVLDQNLLPETDPKFVHPAKGDHHLTASSPTVGKAGTDAAGKVGNGYQFRNRRAI
jgi:hypothetical protein